MGRCFAWRRHIAVAMAFALPFMVLLPAGCGGGGDGAISEVVLSSLVLQDSFALFYPVPSKTAPRIPPYQVNPDLSNVVGLREAALPQGAARELAAKGFIVTQGAEDTIYRVYGDTAGGKFVTVDALLHAFYLLCDHTFREAERNELLPDLEGLVASLYDTMERMCRGSQGVVREAASKDLAYLGVAARLLDVEVDIPPDIQGAVEQELELIAAHSGSATSPALGYREDYSRYVPSGHYSGDREFERYYQAMTWMGRMGFNPRTGATPTELAKGRDMTRQALLLVGALHMGQVDGEPALKVWDRIYQPTSFVAGVSDSLNAYLYTRLAGEDFGRRFALSRLADDAAMDAFIDHVLSEQASSTEAGGGGSGAGEKDQSFRLFGRRYAPDSDIFQQLVAPQVTDRLMPRGLDVPAAFGSDRALEILDKLYGDTKFEGYSENMRALRKQFSLADPAQARLSVYWSLMDTLRVILKPCGEGYPSFMCGTAWEDRGLYAFLGSWAEMRHGAIPYGEQGNTEGTAPSGTAIKGYVEPRPEAFARLAATTDMLRRGLSDRGLAGAAAERLDALNRLLLSLKGMAEKELRNEPLTAEEYQAVAGIGDTLEYLSTFPVEGREGKEEPVSETDASMALVSDVYADSVFGEALEAAIGRPAVYYVIAPVEGKPTLTVGAGFSYYEFIKSSGERLTDESWRGMIKAGQAPAPPAWTTSFLTP